MATLAEILRREYGPQLAVPEGLAARMGLVQAQYGSNRASARAVGVDERTWRRWLSGSTRPRPSALDKLGDAAARVRGQSIRFEFRSITVRQSESGRRRTRTLDVRGLRFDPDANARVAANMAAGNWAGAARAWRDGVRDAQYKDLLDEQFEFDDSGDLAYEGEAADADYVMTPLGISA